MTITPKTSRGLRVLNNPPKQDDLAAEKDDLMKEIASIEQWWREPRWKGTTRTFTGMFVKISLCVMCCVLCAVCQDVLCWTNLVLTS